MAIDPLDVLFAARLASNFARQFQRDVVIDIYCYRRHGHNETDEPAFTQPHLVREDHDRIHQSRTLFRQRLIAGRRATAERLDAM